MKEPLDITKKNKINHSDREKNVIGRILMKMLIIAIGAFLASIGLEIFLIPNNIIDGGIVGISIMASYISGIPISLFLLILNIPFLYLGYRHIGKTFALSTLYAVCCLSIGTSLFHPVPRLTDDFILASIFGGIILGVGVGLIIRNGGSLDGTEVLAIIFDRKTSFSVGEIIMFFNLFILSSAGIVFGWDNAMYSLLAYYVAFKTIDITIEGLNEAKSVFIISDNYKDICEAITDRLGRVPTLIETKDHQSIKSDLSIFIIVTRIEIAKLKSIVNGFDEDALITISSVDVEGKKFKKKKIH